MEADRDGPVLAGEEMLERLRKGRDDALAAVVGSHSPRRLIAAGPGTGKTFTFRKALEAAGGQGLALTFIRNLVEDLESGLGDTARVFTFHAYCKHLMHQHDVAGLREGDYYPPLMTIVVEDLHVLGAAHVSARDIDLHLHDLDTASGLVDDALADADYYNAVAHTDLVYRVLRHFQGASESIPSYPLIVVDEYQDFSLLETTFITLLASKSSVLIAGDDDQALYTTLKHASPAFIRALAQDSTYETLELPYCSRCTSVIVEAVNAVISKATAPMRGNLTGRLTKSFECYLPDKAADSAANPKIIHARCSTANTPYAGTYIAQQIARIPAVDIAAPREKGYPTALVIGPNPFLKKAFEVVCARFPRARLKTSIQPEVDLLDGYLRILKDTDSRLGWRIVVACCPFDGDRAAVKSALSAGLELVEQLPYEYVLEHRELAGLVGRLLDVLPLTFDEEARLTAAVGRPLEDIKGAIFADGLVEDAEAEPSDLVAQGPEVVFTSLVGSKGMSAEHVFVVGLSDGHFPRDRRAITDDEICSLLVALSRTRVRCHLISFGFFANSTLRRSVFLEWLAAQLELVVVDKHYDFAE